MSSVSTARAILRKKMSNYPSFGSLFVTGKHVRTGDPRKDGTGREEGGRREGNLSRPTRKSGVEKCHLYRGYTYSIATRTGYTYLRNIQHFSRLTRTKFHKSRYAWVQLGLQVHCYQSPNLSKESQPPLKRKPGFEIWREGGGTCSPGFVKWMERGGTGSPGFV